MNDANSANAAFVEELTRFHSSRGTTLKIPKFNRSPLDLEKLWHAVRKNGGSSKVCEMKHWAQIGRIFGGTSADKNVSNNIKRAFTKWLLPYERAFFPEEAMSATTEHTSSPTSRRKRQQLLQNSVEKKSKPIHSYRKETTNNIITTTPIAAANNNKANNNNSSSPERELRTTPMEMEETPQPDVSVAMPKAQTSGTTSAETAPSTQRPFVSIPHLTESKYYIILLPTTAAAQGIQENGGHGIRQGLTPLEHQQHHHHQQHQDARTDGMIGISSQVNGGLAGSVGENGEKSAAAADTVTQESSQLGDQLRVSFLVNQNQDSIPSEGQPLLPNIVVFKQDAHQSTPSLPSNEALGSRVGSAADSASPGACDGQASVMTAVSCSGLLCLFDGGIPQNATQPAGMEER